MKHNSQALTVAVLLLAAAWVTGCSKSPQSTAAPAPAPVAELDGLVSGWNVIEPGGDTICSDGTPYKFFVRPGAIDKLMVYFQGGGACWSGNTCDVDLEPTYYINLENTDPGQYNGIFSFDNPQNPLKDHSVVFAPYCTGDLHIGNAVATYEAPETDEHRSHPVTIQHKGYINADAVLDWTYAHFYHPAEIFVTGSSAGSIASPYYAMIIAGQYPEARIAQLGDASGGYRLAAKQQLSFDSWKTLDRLRYLPEFESITLQEFNFELLYLVAAKRNPDIVFAQYDTAEDKVQKYFLSIQDVEPDSLLSLIKANQADIKAEISNFRSYVAAGELHTILIQPEFYGYHVNGTPVRDWVASLINGEVLADVQCTDCAEPQLLEGFVSEE